jgi:hypothetical protein
LSILLSVLVVGNKCGYLTVLEGYDMPPTTASEYAIDIALDWTEAQVFPLFF